MHRIKHILLAAGILSTVSAAGQTIPNPGFEIWATAGPFLSPSGWAGGPGIRQSTNAHSGTYALQNVVDTFTNPATLTLDTVVAMAYTGAATMGPPVMGSAFGGYAFTSRPDSLTGFYESFTAAADSFTIVAELTHWNATSVSRDVIGVARFSSNVNTPSYQRFSLPFQYMTSATPDTAFIGIMPANPQLPKTMGSSVWVDDLAFVTNATAVDQVNRATGAITAYPSPFSNELNISTTGNEPITQALLYDLQGRIIARSGSSSLSTAALPQGVYMLSVVTTNGLTHTQIVVKK